MIQTLPYLQEPLEINVRSLAQAGVVTRSDGTQEVVVAGGLPIPTSDTVEIFSFETGSWRSAENNLPSSNHDGASVPYGDTFLIVGGYDTFTEIDTILKYNPDEEFFETLPQHLLYGTARMAAMLVPDNYFDCS